MVNPITELLGRANQAMQMARGLAGMMQQGAQGQQDPMPALQQMAGSDERAQKVMDVINQNGGDAKAAFYAMAQQKGADIPSVLQQAQNIVNQMQQMGNMKF